jgi:hypothetical protein
VAGLGQFIHDFDASWIFVICPVLLAKLDQLLKDDLMIGAIEQGFVIHIKRMHDIES